MPVLRSLGGRSLPPDDRRDIAGDPLDDPPVWWLPSLQQSWLRGQPPSWVEERSLPFGATVHFHDCFRECNDLQSSSSGESRMKRWKIDDKESKHMTCPHVRPCI